MRIPQLLRVLGEIFIAGSALLAWSNGNSAWHGCRSPRRTQALKTGQNVASVLRPDACCTRVSCVHERGSTAAGRATEDLLEEHRRFALRHPFLADPLTYTARVKSIEEAHANSLATVTYSPSNLLRVLQH